MARLPVAAGVISGNKIIGMYLPAGIHTRVFCHGCRAVEKTVNVTPATAANMHAQLEALNASEGKRGFFDFDHKDERASA